MTLGCTIAVYVDVLVDLVPPLALFAVVHALVERDCASRWWAEEC